LWVIFKRRFQWRIEGATSSEVKIRTILKTGRSVQGPLSRQRCAAASYFDYEDVEEEKKVKHVVTRLKGHATLWWDELQADRRCRGKQKIKSWDRMIVKMKEKFIPMDYHISLFRRMQNLRQKLMTVKEYTEEFYRLNIRVGHRESDDEKVSRYMNGLRYDIQDEMSMVTIRMVEDDYQMALKDEEYMSRK
jgi:hypothetical protein